MPITVTPHGEFTLVKTKLENDYKNTLTFASLDAQRIYFNDLPSKIIVATDYTYMKKDGKVRVGLPIDDIMDYNYCYYNNIGFKSQGTKRFYCFVTRMEYVNENCTDIYIETDVFQSWQFDIEWNRCFVEREHVNNDTIGVHTVPEDIEHGEYINTSKIDFGIGTCHAVVCTSEDPFRATGSYPYQVINSVPTGLHYFVVGDLGTSVNFIGWLTDWASKKSDLSLIQAIYMVPDSMTGYDPSSQSSYWSWAMTDGGLQNAPYHKLQTNITGSFNLGATSIAKPYYSIDTYQPHNNKLFCWPYCFLMIDNNGGSAYEYRFEDFSTNACTFQTIGSIMPGCSIKTVPTAYKGTLDNFSESLPGVKLPIGSWQGDVYTNWLTQNSINIASSIAGDVTSIGLGAGMMAAGYTIGGAGNIASGITGIASTVGTIYQHSRIPNQVFGSVNSGDVMFADGQATFSAYTRCIKAEYARIIDNFFDMFGYKVSRVKIPNRTGRTNWNYIKTIDCNVDGDIPQEDLETIKKACNKGITFWHNPATMYDYSQSNAIVS